ncbi:MAG: hypothetical protein DBX94_05970 [Coriobacteriia bacterium]|nr:MAG: hypothetical protein DBX94_05970 [Coriobacteriia bacterium]
MGKIGEKNSWFKPNFWTLAYLDEAARSRGNEQPVTFGGCLAAVGATVAAFALLIFLIWLLPTLASIM